MKRLKLKWKGKGDKMGERGRRGESGIRLAGNIDHNTCQIFSISVVCVNSSESMA